MDLDTHLDKCDKELMITEKSLKDRLAKAEHQPFLIFEQDWHLDADFCHAFFDRCEQRILEKAPGALTLAHRACEIADQNGNRHLRNLSRGVLVHAFVSHSLYISATKALKRYQRSATLCCSHCRADFHLRRGDVLGETGFSRQAIRSLNKCLRITEAAIRRGDQALVNYLGRIYSLRSVAHHVKGNPVQALEDAGAALMHLSLDAPRGFFLDAIAFISIYLGGGDPSHDQLAQTLLARFRERIKGLKRWSEARARLSWVEGQVLARLGDLRRAREHLEQAAGKIVVYGLPREALAATLDACQLRLRHEDPNKSDIGIARRLLMACRTRRTDLPPKHIKALKALEKMLRSRPEKVYQALGSLRGSFVAPVPNQFAASLRPDVPAASSELTPGQMDIWSTGGGRTVR